MTTSEAGSATERTETETERESLVAWRGHVADVRSRLQVAYQLVDLVAKLHEAGEAHGALSVEAYRVAPGKTPSAAQASLSPPARAPSGSALEAAQRDDAARVAAIATWLVRGGALEGAPEVPEASVPGSVLRALAGARPGAPGGAGDDAAPPTAPELRAALAAQATMLKAQADAEAMLRTPLFTGETLDDVLGLRTEEVPAALREAARAKAAATPAPSRLASVLDQHAPAPPKAAFTTHVIQHVAAPTPSFDPDVAAYQRALSFDRFEQLAPLFWFIPGGRLIFWVLRAIVRSSR